MRAVVQRIKEASVTVNGRVVGSCGPGLLVFLGVAKGDTEKQADFLADKVMNLRIFEDENGKMNRSVLDSGGQMLVVSQFTLLGDCRKGRRPSFIQAAGPQAAEELYAYFVNRVRSGGIHVETGQFRAMMQVALVNDGPVTLILETPA